MNALYVTVSIPLLLILAGFNHAHGLTTFGKTNNQQQPQSQPPSTNITTTQCHPLTNTNKTFARNLHFPNSHDTMPSFKSLLVLPLIITFVTAKPCGNHTICRGMEGTSCVPEPHDSQKKSCLCGNNQPPSNGVCAPGRKGPNHTCNENNDCVKGAECMLSPQDNLKVCKCTENPEFNYDCNGGPVLGALSGLVTLLVVVLSKTLY